MKHCTLFLVVAIALADAGSLPAQDFEFYKKPTNPMEYWRALQFEIGVGKFNVAAVHLQGLLDSRPADKDFLAMEARDGIATFLRLRNVERWSPNKDIEKASRDNVEKLIQLVSEALKKELADPVRIRKFVNNLTATPEEAAFAVKELTRSGVEAIPVLIDLLRKDQPAAQRSAILSVLPLFDVSVVAPLLACLDADEANLKLELLDSLRQRRDYLTFSSRVETDLLPHLWYFSAPLPKNSESLRKKAQEMLLGLLERDPNVERVAEQRLPQWRLVQIARSFLDHKARFGTPDQAMVWKWDGAKPAVTPMSYSDAEEYYGLLYARWALEIQPDYLDAQKIFLTLALDKHFARGGADAPLAKSSPALYAIVATAPYALLTDLTETSLRENRVAQATALLQIIGDRDEVKAARPSDKPGGPKAANEIRPSLLLKALDYPDRRVRFAAVDALLKMPGPPMHQRSAAIVKILAGYLQADAPDDTGKPRALIGDPDRVRAQMLAGVIRQAGFRAEIAKTGRELIQRLQEKADIDLILLDHHLAYPLFADTLTQLKADFRTSSLPIMVVASPDQPTTAHPVTLLGRLAALVAADEHLDLFKAQQLTDDPRRDLVGTRVKKRQDMLRKLVESAGIRVSNDVEDRLEYLVLLTTSPDIPAPAELGLTRLIIPSPDRENRLNAIRNDPKRGHISATESAFANTQDLTPALAVIVARYEIALAPEVVELAKPYWRHLQYGQPEKDGKISQDQLPALALRHFDVEARVNRLVKGHRKVRVIPEVFTEEAFKEELQGFFAIQEPKATEAEKKSNARAAMEWLRKMAVGELTGYPVADVEATLRQALQNPELAALAIDAVARLAGKEAQQDIANVVLGPMAPEIRASAADALIKHIQQRGQMLSEPQRQMLLEKAASEADLQVKSRLLALRGILQSDAKETGARLIDFKPGPPPEPKEKKEEPKN